MIAYQFAYLATKFNPIYWNTACLIVNSNTIETEEEEKEKSSKFDKIATAIGAIQKEGINITCVDINKSGLTFAPDAQNNEILYGLSPLSHINTEVVKDIFNKRPFKSFKDFLHRTKYKKPIVINLIKGGAFDKCETQLNRKEIMAYYLMQTAGFKKELNLRNFAGLISEGLIPQELELQIRIYNFTKHLKQIEFKLGEREVNFLEKFCPEGLDLANDSIIDPKQWDKYIYKPHMTIAREWLIEHHDELLKEYNFKLFKNEWDKYGGNGNISKWEMDSLTFYFHEHELANVDFKNYGIVDFFAIDKDTQIERWNKRGKVEYPIYKISRIAGTVLAKNDNHSSITLLTTTGVVTVKFNRDLYAIYKKQVSQILPNGKKKRIEQSWFSRGTKLIVSGYRSGDDEFRSKVYNNTGQHHIYKITDIVGSEIKIQHERLTPSGSFEEEEEEYV